MQFLPFKLRTRLENAVSSFINSIIKLLIVYHLKVSLLCKCSTKHTEHILLSHGNRSPFHVKGLPIVLLSWGSTQ